MVYKQIASPIPSSKRQKTQEFQPSEINLTSIPINRQLSNEHFEKTLTSIWQTLNTKNIHLPETPALASIGCGQSFETPVLFNFYGSSLQLTLIDIDLLALCHAISKMSESQQTNTILIHSYGHTPRAIRDARPFNLAWIRHPNTFMAESTWTEIFKSTYKKLPEKGVFLSSYYMEKDFLAAKNILKNLNIPICIEIDRNPNAYPIRGVEGYAFDYFILGIYKESPYFESNH